MPNRKPSDEPIEALLKEGRKFPPPKDFAKLHAFRTAMLLNGVDLPGRGMFLTCEHSDADLDATVAAVGKAVEMAGLA